MYIRIVACRQARLLIYKCTTRLPLLCHNYTDDSFPPVWKTLFLFIYILLSVNILLSLPLYVSVQLSEFYRFVISLQLFTLSRILSSFFLSWCFPVCISLAFRKKNLTKRKKMNDANRYQWSKEVNSVAIINAKSNNQNGGADAYKSAI